MDDFGYVSKRYILTFIAIICLLIIFLLIFFYFNIYLVMVLVGIIIICSIIYFMTREKEVEIEEDEEDMYDDEELIEDSIQEHDEKFSLELFYVYVRDVVDLVCRSYSRNNIGFLNNFLGKDLINEIKNKMDSYNSSGYTRMITGLNIRDCKLYNNYISSGYEYFEVKASISKIDCSVQSGVVISGDKNNGKFLDYKLVFCRKVKDYSPVNVINCPSCGSDNSKFNDGKCMNCGQLVSNLDGYYLISFDEF